MDSTNYQPNRQEVLLTTIHHQNSVVEVYFNEKFQLVSEIIHLSNHRVKLYQYDVAQYKKQPRALALFNHYYSSQAAEK